MEYKAFSQYIFDEIIQIDYLKILLIISLERKLKSAGVLFERLYLLSRLINEVKKFFEKFEKLESFTLENLVRN